MFHRKWLDRAPCAIQQDQTLQFLPNTLLINFPRSLMRLTSYFRWGYWVADIKWFVQGHSESLMELTLTQVYQMSKLFVTSKSLPDSRASESVTGDEHVNCERWLLGKGPELGSEEDCVRGYPCRAAPDIFPQTDSLVANRQLRTDGSLQGTS